MARGKGGRIFSAYGLGGDPKYPIEHESSRGFLGVAFREKWCLLSAISVSNAGHN
jgi:hypothetical protein